MKKVLAVLVCMIMLAGVQPVYAAPDGTKGASARAVENASDEAVFHRMGDWFATVGKSDEEKAMIKAKRREERRMRKQEKEAKKQAKKMEKQGDDAMKSMKQEKGNAAKGMKNMGKNMKMGK